MPRPMLALAALALAAAPATADYITPDSVPHPLPSTFDGVMWSPVAEADFATTQYAALGLTFPVRVLTPQVTYATAVALVQGVNAWAAVLRYSFDDGTVSAGVTMDAVGVVVGDFTQPAGSVAVDLVLQGDAFLSVTAFRADGSSQSTFTNGGTGTHRFTLEGDGFVGFAAGASPDFTASADVPFAWGVAAVEVRPAVAQAVPEPGTIVLAALGALGLMARSCVVSAAHWGRGRPERCCSRWCRAR